MTPKYTHLYIQKNPDLSVAQLLGDYLGDISGLITNNRLRFNSDKTDLIIIGTSKQCNILTRFFPTPILNHNMTPSYTVRNLGVTFDSDYNFRKHISVTCRCCFYHILDLRHIRRYISLSVDAIIATAIITNRVDYDNSLHVFRTT